MPRLPLGGSPSNRTRIARGGSVRLSAHHQVHVASVKATGDPAAGLVEGRDLLPHRPVARQGPLVQAELVVGRRRAGCDRAPRHRETRGPWPARSRRRSPVTATCSQSAASSTPPGSTETRSCATPSTPASREQLLNDPLRALVVLLPEVTMPNSPLSVDEVEGRPGLVRERPPDGEIVVDRDRVFDAHRIQGRLDLLDVVLERELRRVRADHDQSVVPVALLPGADVGQRAQPVDAGEGAELDDDHLSPEPGRCERLRIEPGGRAVQFRELALDRQLRQRHALHG